MFNCYVLTVSVRLLFSALFNDPPAGQTDAICCGFRGFVAVSVTFCRNRRHRLRVSVTGWLSQLPGIGHGADAAVLLLHGIDHVVEVLRRFVFVPQCFQSLDHILKGERGEEAQVEQRRRVILSQLINTLSGLPYQIWVQTSLRFESRQKQPERRWPP